MSFLCTLALAGLPVAPAPAAEPAETVLTNVYPVADLLRDGDDPFGTLGDRLVAVIGRDAWATFGGPGTMRVSTTTESLVVRQTRANHQAIVDVLTDWRSVRRQIMTAFTLIELPAGGDADELLRSLGVDPAGPPVPADAAAVTGLKRAAQDHPRFNIRSAPKVTAFAGQDATIGIAADGGDGTAFRVVAETAGDAVRLTLSAAAGGVVPRAERSVRVPAGASVITASPADDGATLLIVATPELLDRQPWE